MATSNNYNKDLIKDIITANITSRNNRDNNLLKQLPASNVMQKCEHRRYVI